MEDPLAPHVLLRAGEHVWRHLPVACSPFINTVRQVNAMRQDVAVGAESARAPEEPKVNMTLFKKALLEHVYNDWHIYINLFIEAMRELAMRREGWTSSITEGMRRRRRSLAQDDPFREDGDDIDGMRQSVGFRIMYDHLYNGPGGPARLLDWFARADVKVIHAVRLNELERLYSMQEALALGGTLVVRQDDAEAELGDAEEGARPLYEGLEGIWSKARFARMQVSMFEYKMRAVGGGGAGTPLLAENGFDDELDAVAEREQLERAVGIPGNNTPVPTPALKYNTVIYEELVSNDLAAYAKLRELLNIRGCEDTATIEALRGYYLTAKIHSSPCSRRLPRETLDALTTDERLRVTAAAAMCRHGNEAAFSNVSLSHLQQPQIGPQTTPTEMDPSLNAIFGSHEEYVRMSYGPPLTRFVILTAGRTGSRWLLRRSQRALADCFNFVARDEAMHMLSLWKALQNTTDAPESVVHPWYQALLSNHTEAAGTLEKIFDQMALRFLSRTIEAAPAFAPVIGGAIGVRINYNQLWRAPCASDGEGDRTPAGERRGGEVEECDRLECGCARGFEAFLRYCASRGIRVIHAVRLSGLEMMIERKDEQSMLEEGSRASADRAVTSSSPKVGSVVEQRGGALPRRRPPAHRGDGAELPEAYKQLLETYRKQQQGLRRHRRRRRRRRRRRLRWVAANQFTMEDTRFSEQGEESIKDANLMEKAVALPDSFVERGLSIASRTLQFTNATKVAEHLLYDRRVGYAVEAGIARARKAHGLVARTTFIESFLGCVPAV